MNIKHKIAKIANRTDRILGQARNNLVALSQRGFEVVPEILRNAKYQGKYVSYRIKLSAIKPNTKESLKLAEKGIQIGMITRLLMTELWFIDDLRKELRDAPIELVSIDKIKSVMGTEGDRGTGFDQMRYDEADFEYPIYVNHENIVVDGNHRYKKALEAGEKNILVQYVGKPHLELFNCDI